MLLPDECSVTSTFIPDIERAASNGISVNTACEERKTNLALWFLQIPTTS